jgi:hypothetical protein
MRLCRLIEDLSREGVDFSLKKDSQHGLTMVPKPLLRHDIDFSLYALDDLAKLESDLGQEAIYLFRPDSRTYNLFSLESMNLVKRIQDLGHKIGLHIDRRSISDAKPFDDFIQSIRERFHSQVGVSMNFVSWHRPFEADLAGPETIFGMNSLYSKSRWSKSNYISDSAGSWNQEKELKLFMFCASSEYFHLLIHPEWWINDSPSDSFSESMAKQFCDSIYALKSELRTFDELKIADRIYEKITDLKNL